MDQTEKRFAEIERVLDRLVLMQEHTTKNIDSLTRDIKTLIAENGDNTGKWMRLDDKCSAAHNRIDKIEKNLSRVIWIVISAILVAIINIVMTGYAHT